jgi:hypothetical protein
MRAKSIAAPMRPSATASRIVGEIAPDRRQRRFACPAWPFGFRPLQFLNPTRSRLEAISQTDAHWYRVYLVPVVAFGQAHLRWAIGRLPSNRIARAARVGCTQLDSLPPIVDRDTDSSARPLVDWPAFDRVPFLAK